MYNKHDIYFQDERFCPLFGNVNPGEMFIYDNQLCVRTSEHGSGQWEAFGFTINKKFYLPHTERVQRVRCKISYEPILIRDLSEKTHEHPEKDKEGQE